MTLFRSIALACWAWQSTLAQFPKFRIWLPFGLIALCQLLALWALISFDSKGLRPVVLPILHLFGGEAATHYPTFYYFLPLVFSRISLLIGVVIASMAVGAATLHFANAFGREAEPEPWKSAARHYPALFLMTALLAATVWGVSELMGLIPTELMLGSRKIRWLARGGVLMALVLIQSLLVYGSAWVLLQGNPIFLAIRNSMRVTFRTFLPTLIIVSLPALMLYPLSYLAGRIDLYSNKLRPETIAIILGSQVVLELFFGFLLVGAITRLFLWRLEPVK